MRRISHICLLSVLVLAFATSASAQNKPQAPKQDETVKTKKQILPNSKKAEDEPLDLDAFFKRGEEAAKKGSSCEKPADPIA